MRRDEHGSNELDDRAAWRIRILIPIVLTIAVPLKYQTAHRK
jgi:hypothetical protein